MAEKYRIREKQNASVNGSPVTLFKLFAPDADAYVFAGQYSAQGYNASDERCIDAFERFESASDYEW